jgi:spermidine synthase
MTCNRSTRNNSRRHCSKNKIQIPGSKQNFSRWILFVFFFVSGFCGLVYQVIWTRLAFASFGIITPVLSVVISVFMLGLSLGSWLGGRFASNLARKTMFSAATFYALAEFVIGLSAFAVPRLFALGEHVLLSSGEGGSFRYLFLSAIVLAISILPWCVFMGATFPLMMAYIRERNDGATDSFSYLYVANVLGAMCGTFFTAVFFIELFGFRTTLHIAAVGNFAIALGSMVLGAQSRHQRAGDPARATRQPIAKESAAPIAALQTGVPGTSSNGVIKWILFSTGFCAMAMEVVWTRMFTPVLKTQVYSFALIVFVYLGATLAGSLWYRRHFKLGKVWNTPSLIMLLILAALLPIPAADPRFVRMDLSFVVYGSSALVVLASIFPLCAILGYLTPGLIDKFCLGNPAAAGRAYAINVLGCILGPLVASYLLLPFLTESSSLIILTIPILGFYTFFWKSLRPFPRLGSAAVGALLLIYCLGFSRNFADSLVPSSTRVEVRRDYAASLVSADPDGNKQLVVNGVGMTALTPITKFMVHLPLSFHEGADPSVLVICFGMGTSYRSALSWDVDTTVVELVPSVPKEFGYYHSDAAEVLKNPKGHIVIDDGRRFLKRTPLKFDVIATDPPPPLQAAGSSLLYSPEFFELVKQHLKPKGIVQIWLPGGDLMSDVAVVRSVYSSFPYVRSFPSIIPNGVHMLCSMEPIEHLTVEQLLARMPPGAKKDLMQWAGNSAPAQYLGNVVSNEVPTEKLLNPDPSIRVTDDKPYNEYYLLRSWRKSFSQ